MGRVGDGAEPGRSDLRGPITIVGELDFGGGDVAFELRDADVPGIAARQSGG